MNYSLHFYTKQADHFCNAIGILQQTAPPATFSGFDRAGNRTPQQQQEDHAPNYASMIARCAKDIDVLIDSLPSEDSTPELQVCVHIYSSSCIPTWYIPISLFCFLSFMYRWAV